MSSHIEIEDKENDFLFLPQSEMDFPHSHFSLFINNSLKEFDPIKKTFTTEIGSKHSQNNLTYKIPKSSKTIFTQGILRSFSFSKSPFIQNSPLMYFKKSAYINNITIVNKLTNQSPLLSRRSSNLKAKLSSRLNILKLGITSHKRKLTSNQISNVLLQKMIGETDKKNSSNFPTQIIKQSLHNEDDKHNLNTIINKSNINDNLDHHLYTINIIKPQTSSVMEFENIKKQIMQTAKCVYAKPFSEFCGFAAFTFKSNEETFLDKIDIVLNKQLHYDNTLKELCHCFGMFPCMNEDESISNLLKERFHKHLLHQKEISFKPVNALIDTFIHYDKKIIHNYNNNPNSKQISFPILLSLLVINNNIYITNNSSSKCIAFNINNISISTLTKNQPPVYTAYKDDFQEKKQQQPLQYSPTPNKNISQSISSNSIPFFSPNNHNHNFTKQPIITELSLNQLHFNDQIDFIVIVNENISNVLTNKEIVLAILSSLLSNTLSYERTLETAIDSICIEAAKKKAKFPLSVLFLPMKGYFSIINSNQKEKIINDVINKLKSHLINDDILHNQCVICKDNKKKTSELTIHNHLSTHDFIECKNNGAVNPSFSSFSCSESYESSCYKEVERCKRVKKIFCGCFA